MKYVPLNEAEEYVESHSPEEDLLAYQSHGDNESIIAQLWVLAISRTRLDPVVQSVADRSNGSLSFCLQGAE
jgi:hypothetical protein